MAKYLISYDIGGTRNRIALVTKSFKIKDLIETSSASSSKKALLRQIKELFNSILLKNKLTKSDVESVGISFGGGIDKKGRIFQAPNQRIKKGTNLVTLFAKTLGKKVYILNDLNAAAYGELNFGRGKGYRDFICITFSTGVGAGIIIDGRSYLGFNNSAGEIGSMVVDMNEKATFGPGKYGNFELYASGTGVENMYKKTTGKNLNAYEIQKLAEKGNRVARKVFDKSAEAIGFGLTNIINILNPQIIIAYGSHFVKGWNLLMPKAKKIIKRYALANPPIIRTKLGSKAALLGVAKYAELKGKI